MVLLAAERTRERLEQIACGVPVDGFMVDPSDVAATVVAMKAFESFTAELHGLMIQNMPR